MVEGEQRRLCFLPFVQQTKAAFHFPRDALRAYLLREELLNLEANPIPFLSPWPLISMRLGARGNADLQRQVELRRVCCPTDRTEQTLF